MKKSIKILFTLTFTAMSLLPSDQAGKTFNAFVGFGVRKPIHLAPVDFENKFFSGLIDLQSAVTYSHKGMTAGNTNMIVNAGLASDLTRMSKLCEGVRSALFIIGEKNEIRDFTGVTFGKNCRVTVAVEDPSERSKAKACCIAENLLELNSSVYNVGVVDSSETNPFLQEIITATRLSNRGRDDLRLKDIHVGNGLHLMKFLKEALKARLTQKDDSSMINKVMSLYEGSIERNMLNFNKLRSELKAESERHKKTEGEFYKVNAEKGEIEQKLQDALGKIKEVEQRSETAMSQLNNQTVMVSKSESQRVELAMKSALGGGAAAVALCGVAKFFASR